jgi:hypothetical protein
MAVEVNGTVYEGSGSTKKKAKLSAAEKALASFVQFPNASEAAQALGRPITGGDFTADVTDSSPGALFNNFDPSKVKNEGRFPLDSMEIKQGSKLPVTHLPGVTKSYLG